MNSKEAAEYFMRHWLVRLLGSFVRCNTKLGRAVLAIVDAARKGGAS